MPPVDTKGEYLFERKLINQIVVTFILLVSLEAIYLFVRHDHIFTKEFLLDVYLTLSVVLLSGAVWHLKSYGTDLESVHLGMMTGMTLGMQTGMMVGIILGATDGFMPPFMVLNFTIMIGLVYMVYTEVTENKGRLHKSPPSVSPVFSVQPSCIDHTDARSRFGAGKHHGNP